MASMNHITEAAMQRPEIKALIEQHEALKTSMLEAQVAARAKEIADDLREAIRALGATPCA